MSTVASIFRFGICERPDNIFIVVQIVRSIGLLQERLTVRHLIRDCRIDATVPFVCMPVRQYERNIRDLCLLVCFWLLGLRGSGTRFQSTTPFHLQPCASKCTRFRFFAASWPLRFRGTLDPRLEASAGHPPRGGGSFPQDLFSLELFSSSNFALRATSRGPVPRPKRRLAAASCLPKVRPQGRPRAVPA